MIIVFESEIIETVEQHLEQKLRVESTGTDPSGNSKTVWMLFSLEKNQEEALQELRNYIQSLFENA